MPKVASTFIYKTLRAIQSAYPVKKLHEVIKASNIKGYLKFVFVRDPYKRLFSGYMDKFFAQWAMKTFSLMNDAVKMSRSKATENEIRCHSDITFREYINYIINTDRINRHLDRYYKLCKVCHVDYNFIGKLETMDTDFEYFFKKLNFSRFSLTKNSQKRTQNELWIVAHDIFRKDNIEKCMDLYNRIIRYWRHLQIRGLISMKISMPFKKKDMKSLSKIMLYETFVGANNQSLTDPNLKNYGKEAFLQAYSTIPRKDLERLFEALKPDCLYFGYDPRPRSIFDQDKTKQWSYDYFDVL